MAFSGCSTGAADVTEIVPAETIEEVEDVNDLEEEKIEEAGQEGEATEEEVEVLVQEGEVKEEEADVPVQIISISPEEVFGIMENGEDYLIVDVRTVGEYNEGHLEGALLIPVDELEGRLNELPMDKPVIVYCRSGSRSRRAAETLVNNGYTMVYDMGGINNWIAEGYPIIVEEQQGFS